MNDVRTKYNLDSVEITLKNGVLEFTLQDTENDSRTIDEFHSLAVEIDDFLKIKYFKLYSVYKRSYLFNGGEAFEVGRIDVNKFGKVIAIKEY